MFIYRMKIVHFIFYQIRRIANIFKTHTLFYCSQIYVEGVCIIYIYLLLTYRFFFVVAAFILYAPYFVLYRAAFAEAGEMPRWIDVIAENYRQGTIQDLLST